MKKFVFVFVLFILTFVPVSNAGAVSDVVKTITSSDTSLTTLCGYNQCNNYKYILVSYTGNPVHNSILYLRFYTNGGSADNAYVLSGLTGTQIMELNQTAFTGNYMISYSSYNFNDVVVTLTLTDTLPDSEPSEPCPDCDCDSPFIVSLFSGGFWSVFTALSTIIVPVIALFIVFRLVHDLLWGKG